MSRLRRELGGKGGPRPQILLALCAAGVVLFNFPLLVVWDNPVTVFGLPLLPVALFVIWGGLIVVLALVNEGPLCPMGKRPGRLMAGAATGEAEERGQAEAAPGPMLPEGRDDAGAR